MRKERAGHTLQPTALVNEAYLRLVDLHRVQWQDRAHFFAMSARLMRHILVNVALSKGCRKRGGGVSKVSFDEAPTREAFLQEAWVGDEMVRHEVESLLAHQEAVADFIETPALHAAASLEAHRRRRRR